MCVVVAPLWLFYILATAEVISGQLWQLYSAVPPGQHYKSNIWNCIYIRHKLCYCEILVSWVSIGTNWLCAFTFCVKVPTDFLLNKQFSPWIWPMLSTRCKEITNQSITGRPSHQHDDRNILLSHITLTPEPAISCPILIMPNTWLGSDKYQF